MFKHSLLLIYRNFLRFKGTFFINLIGLSTGLACAILIYLWVTDELEIDKFHEKDDRLYQVMSNREFSEGIETVSGTGGALGETLVNEMPEVEYATVMTPPSWFKNFTVSVENTHVIGKGNFVGKDFFNVFSYELLQGDKDQVLADKNSIVISEQLARNLFRSTNNVVGKTIEWKWLNIKRQCIISGVFKDMPSNSTFNVNFVVPFKTWEEIVPDSKSLDFGPFSTFIVLRSDADRNNVNEKIINFIKAKVSGSGISLLIRPYSEAYLYDEYKNGEPTGGGRIAYVRLFSVIGFLILVIACINFMNLSTAKASRRVKEVGIKKAIGAHRNVLIFQYLGESLLMAFLSLLVAIVIVEFSLTQFNEITGKSLTKDPSMNFILAMVGITLFTGIIAGSYPALYLSGFNPVAVLKGKFANSLVEGWTRKGLVVFQLTLSVVFIVGVLVVYKQIEFVQLKNPGYDKDHVIYFDMEGKAAENIETFLFKLKQVPGVANASSTMRSIVITSTVGVEGLRWEGKNLNDEVRVTPVSVNYELIETLGIEMKEGRSFSRNFSADNSAVIFNEAAIEAMQLNDPVGKTINLWNKDRQIVGVAKNFHFQSLHEKVKPLLFLLEPEHTMFVVVKIEAGKTQQTIDRLQAFYKEHNSGFAFDYAFLEHDYQQQYVGERRVSVLSKYFAGITIIISCLGLFGLAGFTVERRTKEIGIRKVLGATEAGILYLLSGDFFRIIFISIFLALPMSYFLSTYWLDGFAYRISLEPWYFIYAALGTLIITWATIGLQTLHAAKINPTECLRDE